MKTSNLVLIKFLWCSALIIFGAICLPAKAQYEYAGTINYKYNEKVDQSTNVSSLGDDLFGESTNFENGATTFSYVDVKAKSNVKIPIQLGRILNIRGASGWSPKSQVNQYPTGFSIFGGQWESDAPFIQNDSLADFGWVADGGAGRCTSGNFSKSVTNVSQVVVPAHNFFYGNDIYIAGYGYERLLALLPDGIVPGDGTKYVGTTKSNWKVSCLPSIKNGGGEGFVVTLPDGAKYFFDWLVSVDTGYITTSRGSLNLRRFRLYATRAIDRFGGSVDYIYDATYPVRINQIKSSDGATISISYNNQTNSVSSVSLGSRTWQYGLVDGLMVVTLPDNSKWTYSNAPGAVDGKLGLNECDISVGTRSSNQAPGPNEVQTFQVTHPSGAVGVFSFRPIMFGYNGVSQPCGSGGDYRPKAYISNALFTKAISGPGVATKTWEIKYYPSWSYASECVGCPTTATTVVTKNANQVTSYIFGNNYGSNAGQMLSRRISGGGVSSSESYTYLSSAVGQPFPDQIGEDKYQIINNIFLLKNRPLKAKVVSQNGRVFSWTVESYDQFARPTRVTKSSTTSP